MQTSKQDRAGDPALRALYESVLQQGGEVEDPGGFPAGKGSRWGSKAMRQ